MFYGWVMGKNDKILIKMKNNFILKKDYVKIIVDCKVWILIYLII